MTKVSHMSSFQLLEISLISAQDLATTSKSIRTFAVAWVNPSRKLTTRVDQNGHANPTWNEKFVFRVDESFLKDDETSKIMIEIYASAWLRDVLIGTATINVSDLQNNAKMRYVAIQLRRPSGRPQGILNVGLSLLDNTMRSMPLYSELSTSVVGDRDRKSPSNSGSKMEDKIHAALYRSRSERTTSDYGFSRSKPASSVCFNNNKKGPGSMCIGSSIVNGSEISNATKDDHSTPKMGGTPNNTVKNKSIPNPYGNGSIVNGSLCNSDVGPSPSVVAAAIAKGIYPLPHRGTVYSSESSSMVDEWADEDSVEGLKTKIERWRTEQPPVYDTKASSRQKFMPSSQRCVVKAKRRSRSRGASLFSCFALGCEISISCGGKGKAKKRRSGKVHVATSELTYDNGSYVR